MTFSELQKKSNEFRPAFWLDESIPRGLRAGIRRVLYVVALASLLLALQVVTHGTAGFLAVFFLAIAFILIFASFEFYYAALYFLEVGGVTFELARIIRDTPQDDLTAGFLDSYFGASLRERLGVSDADLGEFMSSRKARVGAGNLAFGEGRVSLADYGKAVFEADAELKTFLFAKGILEADFIGALEWLERGLTRFKSKKQWWSRSSLGKVQGLGKSLSNGQIWLLRKYGGEVGMTHDLSGIDINASYHAPEVEELEQVLSRATEANALLVAEDLGGGIDVVNRLAKRLSLGAVPPALEHKQMFMLDANSLIAATGDKNKFETELMKIMKESVKAGNVIFVIADLPAFMASAVSIGTDIISILDPFIKGSDLQMIAISDTTSFHQTIENHPVLSERFEKISVKSGENEETIRFLEDNVQALESKNGIFFTYQALTTIATAADRYFVAGVMPDKALDLLIEMIPVMQAAGKHSVGKQDVLDLVEKKTGIPVAGVKDEEREKLTHLEDILRKKVIGQEPAIVAISNAMRRARSGVSNPDRPMGSFLFIGPTGVGKTETTKALAEVFFGDREKIIRFDMSEYSSDDALNRLIGSFQTGKAGTLATALRENSYGVLLLDEFEKANKEVHNLFLQVLDEGVFSDMLGKRVNARNTIIIATSNAGSDLIWQMSQQGKDLAEAKDAVVNDIISKAIFKPELMNRFDGVILFHALREDDVRQVSRLQLERLKKRLEERKINLQINDALVEFLVRQGSDPKFGARPINRAIQDTIEGLIAKKLISGEAKAGMEIVLTPADLEVPSVHS